MATGGDGETAPAAAVLEAFCTCLRQTGGTQSTWLAVGAYLVWEVAHALEVAEVAQVAAAACDAVSTAMKPGGGPAQQVAEGHGWGSVAWGLLVLEGAARVAWGVPLSSRCDRASIRLVRSSWVLLGFQPGCRGAWVHAY